MIHLLMLLINAGNMKRRIILTLLSLLLFMLSYTQDKTGNLTDAAKSALNPIARVVKLMLQPNYYMYNNGGNAITLITRVITPYNAIIIPGIRTKNKNIFSLCRQSLQAPGKLYERATIH
jgi:hypothetical protein